MLRVDIAEAARRQPHERRATTRARGRRGALPRRRPAWSTAGAVLRFASAVPVTRRPPSRTKLVVGRTPASVPLSTGPASTTIRLAPAVTAAMHGQRTGHGRREPEVTGPTTQRVRPHRRGHLNLVVATALDAVAHARTRSVVAPSVSSWRFRSHGQPLTGLIDPEAELGARPCGQNT